MEVVVSTRTLRSCEHLIRASGAFFILLTLKGEAYARLERASCVFTPRREEEVVNATCSTGRRVLIPHGTSFVTISIDGPLLRDGIS